MHLVGPEHRLGPRRDIQHLDLNALHDYVHNRQGEHHQCGARRDRRYCLLDDSHAGPHYSSGYADQPTLWWNQRLWRCPACKRSYPYPKMHIWHHRLSSERGSR
jgi:hypothetical protein